MNHFSLRDALPLVLLPALIFPVEAASPQTPRAAQEESPPACNQYRALALVQQQIAEVKKLDDEVARISLLVRMADLLWSSQEDTARSLFTEAYELATQNYQRKGDEVISEGTGLVSIMPDQRFVVIRAVARRDRAWAQKLAQRATDETAREAEKAANANARRSNPGEKFIEVADSLLPEQKQSAIEFARASLRYPLDMNALPRFLFQLAAVDQGAADQLYREALSAYARSSVGEVLLLAAYPFGLYRAAGPNANSVWYTVPPQYVPNALAQREFMALLLGRARQLVQTPPQTAANNPYSLPDAAQIYLALNKLEPLIARDQPALVAQVSEIKVLVGSLMTAETQHAVTGMWREQQEIDRETVSSLTEKMERESDPGQKDHLIFQAVMAGVKTESLEWLEDLTHKVSDSKVRDQLLNWLYFSRAQKAVKEKALDEATRLAKKVEALDQRAYLFFEIAQTAVKQLNDKARAIETLNEAAAMATKAPNTAEKARSLLGIASLFIKYERTRGFEVMSEAIRTINRIPDQDYTRAYLIQRVEAPKWGSYFSFNVTGFRLENSFRELGEANFEGALELAGNLENKSLRATAIIAVAAPCLENPPTPEQPKKRKPKRART